MPEGIDDGSVAAENVSKADGHEALPAATTEMGSEHLADSLRHAQDADRIGSLVGAYVHEPIDSLLKSDLEDVQCAENIGPDRGLRVPLEELDVLVSCGVKNHLRLELLE